ncbi:MAG: glycoside hydrolase family 3 N-terminal domain-containing protein [Coriobacteriales bacterium]|nr:glycoside hydrolase family 3 N-terminal domain-containing protein [Coriobacteriales bacterium]
MRKRLFVSLLATVMAVMLLVGCAQNQTSQSQASSQEATSSSDAEARAKELVSSMTTEQKLTQMMIVTLRSDPQNTYAAQEFTQEYADMFKKYDFGGLLLFQANMDTPKQTVTLIRDAQQASMDADKSIPMFVAVDEEGGSVSRVPFGVTGVGNMALQATGDTALIERSATLLGTSIASLGYNMNFAPVVDVNSNPNNPILGVRSFSDDPQIIAANAVIFQTAMQQTGVCTALKHFPGHGNANVDSHTGLPLLETTLDELRKCELIPFKAGIEAGTDMIMTAHIRFPNIEKETYTSIKDGKTITLPATLSHTILTGLLREELGYKGIIVTDAMRMGAIQDHFDRIDAAILAINAGADMLLAPVDIYKGNGLDYLADVETYIADLTKRVEAGDASEDRLNESVTRILKTKIEKGIMDNTLATSAEEQIKKAEEIATNTELIAEDWDMAKKAVTLVKNEDNMLPINGTDGKHTLILYPTKLRQDTVEYVEKHLQEKKLLSADGVSHLCYDGIKADDAQLQELLSKADRVLLLTQVDERNEEMGKVIEQAHKDGKKVALISLNTPYEVAYYSEADAALCALQYSGFAHDTEGNGPVNMNVAVALEDAFGEDVPKGTLPVAVPKYVDGSLSASDILYERGFGLKNWGK